ncbi:hypothetical protein PTHTG4_34810 [Parageobacillus thermoglucosidasius]|nr:hypothetical protein PTHTG4_34810 [Parageobacillus thermoglucosidasius]
MNITGEEITNRRFPFELLMENARSPKGSNSCCSKSVLANGTAAYRLKSFGWQGPNHFRILKGTER